MKIDKKNKPEEFETISDEQVEAVSGGTGENEGTNENKPNEEKPAEEKHRDPIFPTFE